jgi:hypothetical protein
MAQGRKLKNSKVKFEIEIPNANSVPPFQFVTGQSELYCSLAGVYKD